MSPHSPSAVKAGETISRFIFSPMHVNKKNGGILPSAFSYVANKGCSVQRDECAEPEEIERFVRDFLNAESNRAWHAVLSANVSQLRDIRLMGKLNQAICIYDSGEPTNPAHAELGQSNTVEDGDKQELRKHLRDCFRASVPTPPVDYRQGSIWRELSEALRERQ